VLTAAWDLVMEVGYAGLTIEGIAARAGVGKQTIYRWWPSKGAVLFDAFLTVEGDQPAGLPDSGDLDADLTEALRATVAEMNDPRYDEPMRALHIEILQDPALAAVTAERWDDPRSERRKNRLRSAQDAGQLPDDLDLDVAIELLWAPLLNRWLHNQPLTAQYADEVVQTALRGLRRTNAHDQQPDATP
jgi:AcrR family transcriptional regulator